jgi:histidinol phosphatase-like PHP family hydrolase
MAGLVAEVERLTGKKFAFVENIPKQSWEADQEEKRLAREEEIRRLNERIAELEAIIARLEGTERESMIKEKESIVIPPPYQKKQAPKWMRDRGVAELIQ